MEESDFDALCEGLSAEEVKRLRKILMSWAAGDEHSFPVQMALLTRAQWQMAARAPRQLVQSCELMEQKLADYRAETAKLHQNIERTMAVRCQELATVLAAQQQATVKNMAGMEANLAKAEVAGHRICHELEQGALAWKEAKAAFESERQHLEACRRGLEAQRTQHDWLWVALLLVGMVALGVAIGLWLAIQER